MAIAGTLAVNILAKTDKFKKGIKGARTSLSGFGKSIATMGKTVTGFGATLVGVAGVAGFGAFAKSQIASATLLGDTADKLGIATGKLELMRFAAEATGVSQTALDTALQRMVRRVGEASRGFGSAAKTLQSLGLNAEKLNRLAPDQMFNRIGNAVNRIPDRGGQLAAMMAVFDTEGVGLLNTAAQGVDSFASAFERAGGPTASEGVKNAREFTFAVQEFKTAIGASGRDFVLGVTPAALEAVRGLRVVMDNIGLTEEGTAKSKAIKKRGRFQGLLGLHQLNRRISIGIGGELIGGLFGTNLFKTVSQKAEVAGRQRRQARQGVLLPQTADDSRQRAEETREQRRQTRILLESLELQRRAVFDRGPTVTLEPATFE